jgi:cell division protein FtsB
MIMVVMMRFQMRSTSTKSKHFMLQVGIFLIGGYFITHSLGLGGGKGYLSLAPLDEDILLAQNELAKLRDHREWLQHRVFLVAEDKIDQDLLGEIARSETGLFAADELIIDLN